MYIYTYIRIELICSDTFTLKRFFQVHCIRDSNCNEFCK